MEHREHKLYGRIYFERNEMPGAWDFFIIIYEKNKILLVNP